MSEQHTATPRYGQTARLPKLLSFYHVNCPLELEGLPATSTRVTAWHANGRQVIGRVQENYARFEDLTSGTYLIDVRDADDRILAQDFTTVAQHPGERPVHAFVSSYTEQDVAEINEWLSALRCTVVQFYDWMQTYTEPLGPLNGWHDPSGRVVSFTALQNLTQGVRKQGAIAHAYAPIYAVNPEFAHEHPELLMYRSDGEPQRLFDKILLADPSNVAWQKHFITTYGEAADRVGFNGFHVDTYGFPRAATNNTGDVIDMGAAYSAFLQALRVARPDDLISFNQVDGEPGSFPLPDQPSFRYCEIWTPNDRWRHFEGIVERTSGRAGHNIHGTQDRREEAVRGSLACYPPVWGNPPDTSPDRQSSLRTVLLSEAVATCLGVSPLIYGDKTAALCDPYYPQHAELTSEEASTALDWHGFSLAVRDLFIDGEDSSWTEIADENGAVTVTWEHGLVRPEPLGESVMARVARGENWIAVSALDLSGSKEGSWSQPTAQGRCDFVTINVLVHNPDEWRTDAAQLSTGTHRFETIESRVVEHREGLALSVALPLCGKWSVLRLIANR